MYLAANRDRGRDDRRAVAPRSPRGGRRSDRSPRCDRSRPVGALRTPRRGPAAPACSGRRRLAAPPVGRVAATPRLLAPRQRARLRTAGDGGDRLGRHWRRRRHRGLRAAAAGGVRRRDGFAATRRARGGRCGPTLPALALRTARAARPRSSPAAARRGRFADRLRRLGWLASLDDRLQPARRLGATADPPAAPFGAAAARLRRCCDGDRVRLRGASAGSTADRRPPSAVRRPHRLGRRTFRPRPHRRHALRRRLGRRVSSSVSPARRRRCRLRQQALGSTASTARRRRLGRLRPLLHAIAERAQDRGEVLAGAAGQRRHRRRRRRSPTRRTRPAGLRPGAPGAPGERRPDQVGEPLEDVDAHRALAADAVADDAVERRASISLSAAIEVRPLAARLLDRVEALGSRRRRA